MSHLVKFLSEVCVLFGSVLGYARQQQVEQVVNMDEDKGLAPHNIIDKVALSESRCHT